VGPEQCLQLFVRQEPPEKCCVYADPPPLDATVSVSSKQIISLSDKPRTQPIARSVPKVGRRRPAKRSHSVPSSTWASRPSSRTSPPTQDARPIDRHNVDRPERRRPHRDRLGPLRIPQCAAGFSPTKATEGTVLRVPCMSWSGFWRPRLAGSDRRHRAAHWPPAHECRGAVTASPALRSATCRFFSSPSPGALRA